jgi:hypothetical protein
MRTFCKRMVKNILWRICPLLGHGSVNTLPKHTLSTIEGYPLLGNGPINSHSWQQKTVFTVGSVRRSYKRRQSVVLQIRIEGVQRSKTECSWKSEQFQWSVQSEEDYSVSDSDLWTAVTSCTTYKDPINSIIKYIPRLLSHANCEYATIYYNRNLAIIRGYNILKRNRCKVAIGWSKFAHVGFRNMMLNGFLAILEFH